MSTSQKIYMYMETYHVCNSLSPNRLPFLPTPHEIKLHLMPHPLKNFFLTSPLQYIVYLLFRLVIHIVTT